MSIGNTRSEGNKGINFPWQLKMLLGQECACDQLKQISSNTDQVEFLLSSILTTLQAETEYEAKFVVDTCDSNKVYLEVRVWNTDTSTWGPITYYVPGSATAVTPTGAATPGCLIYTDPSAVLGLILGAIQAGNLILQDIDNNTDGLEIILTNLFNLYSAGQQVCADSLSVTLCTEQGATLSNILTELQGTLDVNVTGPVSISGSVEITNDVGNAIPVTVQNVPNVNLDAADDQVGIYGYVNGASGSPVPLNVNATGQVAIQDGGNSITVDGTVALDAATLTALENITVQNGAGAAAVNIQDGGNSITVDDGGGSITVDGTVTTVPSGTQDVNIVSGITLEVNLDQNNDQVQVYGSDLTGPIATDSSGHLQVDILTIPEVEIKNDAGNPIPISDAGGSITVDGAVTVSATNLDIRDLAFATDKVDVTGSTVTIQDGGGSITVDGTVNVGNFPATQNVAVTSIVEVEVKNDTGNPLPISGSVTITDGSGPVTVDGTVTANQGTSPWVVSGTVTATPTGTQDVNIISTIALPVTDNGGSLTVDGTVAATQSGTWNINNISGTISLPTGAATAANQATEIISLNSIDNSLISIDNEVQAINNHFIAVTRTPGLIRATGAGTIAAGARSISVYNAGSAAGDILGGTNNILPGEIFNFSAGGENDTLSAFAYDGTGTTLVITTIV